MFTTAYVPPPLSPPAVAHFILDQIIFHRFVFALSCVCLFYELPVTIHKKGKMTKPAQCKSRLTLLPL